MWTKGLHNRYEVGLTETSNGYTSRNDDRTNLGKL